MEQAEQLQPAGEHRVVLVCDLDRTLIRTEILDETFWAALAAGWSAPLAAARALLRGRAALKRELARRGAVDVVTLPYRPEIVARLREWRTRGGRTALVTSADQAVADQVADHLGVFDEAHGSDGRRNLRSQTKADFLIDRFGRGGFDYIGSVASDAPIWAAADRAVTIGLDRSGRDQAPQGAEHLQAEPQDTPGAMVAALRPHQWLKNLLIFLPLLAAHRTDAGALGQAVVAFLAFSLVASSVYVLNDLLDLPSDRAHPRKRVRPFASGRLALRNGLWMAPGLMAAGLLLGLSLGPTFLAILAVYLGLTSAYSMRLKRVPVVDICTLAGLYTLRIAAGAAATGIPLSVWLMAFSMFFFFSLAAVKRQAELVDSVSAGRALNTRRGYQAEDLPLVAMMAVGSGYVSVLVMALYVSSPDVTALYTAPEILFGICAVLLFWISRIVLITHRGRMHDDPVVFAARDPVSLGAFGAVCLLVVLGARV
ncbi:prenyltransferase family protein [Pseudooceanicola batsensis HTCC2597]|uniref:Prenyltransferase family protein n=1 Tax=Pseudooceanicola batsensis (strain ATCC BAA-863 / DSM 15984 / KCTC 12145 / HTCC2597) TaxID=252305 RepID=A3TVB9_PSEBH|nr:UbiA family prenyltransferase [Pseudooceanicola batsensis]EAQ04465.1 prenyltransferase family protein [Pseudooceanicola batsensis HTCC2597]